MVVSASLLHFNLYKKITKNTTFIVYFYVAINLTLAPNKLCVAHMSLKLVFTVIRGQTADRVVSHKVSICSQCGTESSPQSLSVDE